MGRVALLMIMLFGGVGCRHHVHATVRDADATPADRGPRDSARDALPDLDDGTSDGLSDLGGEGVVDSTNDANSSPWLNISPSTSVAPGIDAIPFVSVSGRAPTVWALADDNGTARIVSYNGTSWTEATLKISPFAPVQLRRAPAGTHFDGNNVTALLVGATRFGYQYDTSWRSRFGYSGNLSAVFGVASTVGGEILYGAVDGLILREQSNTLTLAFDPGGGQVNAIWSVEPYDGWVFAVTNNGTIAARNPTKVWAKSRPASELHALAGRSSEDVFAVGTTIVHRDSSKSWQAAATQPASGAVLYGVAPVGTAEYIAVGTFNNLPFAMHFDGASWQVSPLGGLQLSSAVHALRAAWSDAAGVAYVVGDAGTVLRYMP